MTLTLEERNKLAETIVETGGVWLLPFNGRKVEVEPIATVPNWTGRTFVHIKALEGKPFVQKDDYGEGIFRSMTAYKTVYPEQLETVTPDKATVSDEQTINHSTRSIS